MALYKDAANVTTSSSDEFDKVYNIGVAAPHAGIYRCIRCGHEIGIARGHNLPNSGSSPASRQPWRYSVETAGLCGSQGGLDNSARH